MVKSSHHSLGKHGSPPTLMIPIIPTPNEQQNSSATLSFRIMPPPPNVFTRIEQPSRRYITSSICVCIIMNTLFTIHFSKVTPIHINPVRRRPRCGCLWIWRGGIDARVAGVCVARGTSMPDLMAGFWMRNAKNRYPFGRCLWGLRRILRRSSFALWHRYRCL